MKEFIRQKTLWVGLLVVTVVVGILALANFGSTVNPTPKDVPVALVMLDKGVQVPGGPFMNFGKVIQANVTAAKTPDGQDSPFKWTIVDSEQAALDGMNQQQYYGTIVLPADMSQRLLSVLGPNPQPASVQTYLNQGMNYTGASMVSTAFTQIMDGVNTHLREQLLGQAQQPGHPLQPTQIAALMTPLHVHSTTVHPVGTHTSNGNAPTSLSQLIWMGSMISAIVAFMATRSLKARNRFGIVLGQFVGGLIAVVLVVASVLLVADAMVGLSVPDFWPVTLFMVFTAYCFFLAQTAVMNWLGLPGIPVFVLILFFSLPILTLPSEFLPDASRNWLYSWVPLRFSAQGLRDIFYFGSEDLSGPAWVLGIMGAAGALIALASGWRKPKDAAVKAAVQVNQ